jgi:ABC-2 type transport system permease protein
MAAIVHVDPLSYGVDALRGLLINTHQFSLALDFGVLLVVGAIIVSVGAYFFAHIEV